MASNSVDLKLQTDVMTGETVAHFVTSILELLLYQRNQIPFVCKTFKYMISKWANSDENSETPKNFQLEREKSLAQQTLHGIKTMEEIIRKALEKSDVSCVRFLFGATSLTPKEAYTINLPPISRSHSYEHHKLSTQILNQALISLLTSECLYNTFSTSLCPTNVFLDLEMPDADADGWEQMMSVDLCDFPASCKQFVINIEHTLPSDYVDSKCCRELTVFQDISNLSLNSDSNSAECEPGVIRPVGWWEACTVVKGYKQKLIKGSNLWQ